jgi:hypothetical protein
VNEEDSSLDECNSFINEGNISLMEGIDLLIDVIVL